MTMLLFLSPELVWALVAFKSVEGPYGVFAPH